MHVASLPNTCITHVNIEQHVYNTNAGIYSIQNTIFPIL